MPTELPPPKLAKPQSSASGTLAFIAAALTMVLLSYTTLMLDVDAVPADTPQFQGL